MARPWCNKTFDVIWKVEAVESSRIKIPPLFFFLLRRGWTKMNSADGYQWLLLSSHFIVMLFYGADCMLSEFLFSEPWMSVSYCKGISKDCTSNRWQQAVHPPALRPSGRAAWNRCGCTLNSRVRHLCLLTICFSLLIQLQHSWSRSRRPESFEVLYWENPC